jgi:cytochrome c oxidase subunit II
MSSSPSTRRPRHGLIWVASIVAAAVVVGLLVGTGAGARVVESLYPPVAVTEQGAHIRDLYNIVFLIAAVIFFLVEGLIVWTIIAYRRKPTDVDLPPQTHGNSTAEIIWTVVPTLIVAFLFVVSWQTLNQVDTVTAKAETKIRAVAGQFQWEFDYMPPDYNPLAEPPAAPLYTEFVPTGPDGGLHVPTGRTIQLYLTSPDVIHAFYVPQFLFKRDVVPGRINTFDFNVDANQAGQTFRGQCAELCGSGHRLMLFEVHAMTAADFDTWLADKVASAPPPAPPASAGASGEPQPSGAPPASGEPQPSGAPAPSGAAGPGTELSVTAQNTAFTTTELTAPADSPITIQFDNKDTQPHNIQIFKDAIGGTSVFMGEIFTGPAVKPYQVGPLPAGTYPFKCDVHPNMTGTLTVQ